jgi:hypothetical protein
VAGFQALAGQEEEGADEAGKIEQVPGVNYPFEEFFVVADGRKGWGHLPGLTAQSLGQPPDDPEGQQQAKA